MSNGDWVNRGAVLGGMGNTGLSFGTHLHFQMGVNGYSNGNSIDPARYIAGIQYRWR